MTITGKILIDKMRVSIPLPFLQENGIKVEILKQKFLNILAHYFCDRKAYSVTISYGYLRTTLNPARYKPHNKANYTDTNLEMPSEKWLLDLLKDLGYLENKKIAEAANITLIHLTKDIIVQQSPHDYIEFLLKFPLEKNFISSKIYSNSTNNTLRISTPKRNNTKKDILGDRVFIFYDKMQELRNKLPKDIITLKEALTENEIKQLNKVGAQHIDNHNISISNLNLLRCELQYRYKEKIEPLLRFLNSEAKSGNLTVAIIIDALSKKELYKKLEQFYKKELQSVVFYKEPQNKFQGFNSYELALADLINDSNITTLELIYDSFGLKKMFHANLKNITKGISNELYNELYSKFIED